MNGSVAFSARFNIAWWPSLFIMGHRVVYFVSLMLTLHVWFGLKVFNATFNNISVISRRSVSLVEYLLLMFSRI
jgi:hypothetical protein